jgi:hypothetical protein
MQKRTLASKLGPYAEMHGGTCCSMCFLKTPNGSDTFSSGVYSNNRGYLSMPYPITFFWGDSHLRCASLMRVGIDSPFMCLSSGSQ